MMLMPVQLLGKRMRALGRGALLAARAAASYGRAALRALNHGAR